MFTKLAQTSFRLQNGAQSFNLASTIPFLNFNEVYGSLLWPTDRNLLCYGIMSVRKDTKVCKKITLSRDAVLGT